MVSVQSDLIDNKIVYVREFFTLRFSPCFFLYICTMIPPIWILEIDRINTKLGRMPANLTESEAIEMLLASGIVSKEAINDKAVRIEICFRKKFDNNNTLRAINRHLRSSNESNFQRIANNFYRFWSYKR